MKIEQLLVQHFYNSGEVTLQGIGTFKFSPDFVMPKESDKDLNIPDNAITFQYNSRAKADDALIGYINEQTGKMRALAAADLDSYLALCKQFLNIGKAFKIEGIGAVAKNQQGEYEFSQGHSFHSKLQTAPATLKEKKEDKEISFTSENKTRNNGKKSLVAVFSVIGVGLIVTAAWYFLFKKNNNAVPVAVNKEVVIDTPINSVTSPDTLATVVPVAVKPNDGYTFKVVFMTTRDSARAVLRMNDFVRRGHNVIMYKSDSVYFKLAEPFKNPLSDTTHIKDSLNSYYFLGAASIELK